MDGLAMAKFFRLPVLGRSAPTLDDGKFAGPAFRDEMTFRGTAALIKADVRRRLTLEGRRANLSNAAQIAFRPGVVAVVAYRVANYLYGTGHGFLARLIDDFQHLYTGIEIHAGSKIGPGLVYCDRLGGGISEHVTLGENCTVLGGSTMTLNADGIDLTRGRIVLGDYCVVGIGVRIIGAVSLAHATQIKPNSVVLHSCAVVGAILDGVPARQRAVVPIAMMKRWNPLRSVPLSDNQSSHAPARRPSQS